MGGSAGQGYANPNATQQQQGYANDNAGGVPATGIGFPAPQTPNHVPPQVQTPNSAGSITQFYNQPTQQQQQNLAYNSPQMQMPGNPGMPLYPQQQQQTAFMQQQQQQQQQYNQQQQQQQQYNQQQQQQYNQQPSPSGSMMQQPIATQPIPQPSNAMPNTYQPQQQQQSVVAPQQSFVGSQMPQAAATGGSYSSRSAQAYATVGPPTSQMIPASTGPTTMASQNQPVQAKSTKYDDSPAVQAQQNRVLTDCTRKVQEHAYYMKQAMDKDDVSTVLDRASHMVGELGDASSGLLTPKNYYELHMRALDDMPNLEEYFLSLTSAANTKYSMTDLYDYVQYCPRVLPRLYLQISAGSALVRSKEGTPKYVLNDLIEAVKCVQNPLRGLFLRHFLLQATRDKLPDGDDVEDAYEFVLANFIEMNRLWVRIQHLPGDGKSKEQRKRRERERNELRILVGTNLVRLSQLEAVTSKIYGEVILPKILEQITACGDPLAQAYLIDCIIQVFPDEYHIETLPILLAVCPKLRDKVNIRTIMQSLMDRLANYYADEELLDEADTNEVKKNVARESFPMFEECVQKVFQARGPKLVSREVIRLQTALLNFSLKCHPGNMDQVSRCLGVCIEYIRQAANATAIANQTPLLEDCDIKLDQASVTELGKMLSIPLDSLALKVLELDHYADLLQFLPWENRRDVGMTMLRAIDTPGGAPTNVKELEELFSIILPVLRDPHSVDTGYGQNVGERSHEVLEENSLVSKLVHLLDHKSVDVTYEMLMVARSHLSEAGGARRGATLVPVVFSALRLGSKVAGGSKNEKDDAQDVESKAAVVANAGDDNASTPESDDAEENTESAEDTKDSEGEVDACNSAGDGEDITSQDGDAAEEKSDSAEIKTTLDDEEENGSTAVEDTTANDQVDTEPKIDIVVPESCDMAEDVKPQDEEYPSTLSCRKVLLFVQTTIQMLSKGNPELGVKLYLHTALAADSMLNAHEEQPPVDGSKQIVAELLSQAFLLHEEEAADSSAQQRCIVNMVGTLLACQSVSSGDYEIFITKAAQYAAKLPKKQDQCRMVALCSHLFYPVGKVGDFVYTNPQRTLECLQRSLKLADASAMSAPSNVTLFVDLLENYVYFYEENNPVITEAYVTGLVALIREHLESFNELVGADASAVAEAKTHFVQVVDYIERKQTDDKTAERFARIDVTLE